MTPLFNWIPYKLNNAINSATCLWLYTGDTEFKEPFFDETILKCLSYKQNSGLYKSTGDFELLKEWAKEIEFIEPSVFIFHVSRCGSTLISQALGLDPENVVLAEVPFIDEVLRLSVEEEWQCNSDLHELIKAAVAFYCQHKNGKKINSIVKTDSWHIKFLPLIRQLYPQTPFVLLYRRPDEVIRSHQKKRGVQAVPGIIPDEVLGITHDQESYSDLDKHIKNVLQSYYRSFINAIQNDRQSILVNYNEGLEEIIYKVAGIADINISDELKKQINERCRFNAKYPGELFKEDALHSVIEPQLTALFDLYNQLENIRTAIKANL